MRGLGTILAINILLPWNLPPAGDPVRAAVETAPIFVRVETCSLYRRWQAAFNREYLRVLNDEVEYLSWNDFVALKEGPVIPELDRACAGAPVLPELR